MPSLAEPRAKLARAKELMRSFDEEVQTFLRTRPFEGHLSQEGTDHVWRLRIVNEPPLRLGAILGDVAHNHRSALDHLVWQLSLLTTPEPFARSEFPVYLHPSRTEGGRPGFDPDGLPKIRDVPERAQELIAARQPFTSSGEPLDSVLWHIHSLDLADKHRMLPRADVVRVREIAGPDLIMQGAPPELGEVEEGSELLRVPVWGTDLASEDEIRFFFYLALNVPGPIRSHDIWWVLQNDSKALSAFLDEFEPFFE